MDKTFNQDIELSLKLFIVLNRALESVRKQVIKDIKNYNLNLTEFAVLELLYHKGDQPIQKIGDKVLLASSSITYVVDKLEKKNLIERKPCPTDRRITYAVLTEKGAEFMDDIFPKHAASLRKIFAGLDTEEKAIVIEHLKKLGLYAEKL
ncbi:MarR family transcriptional regulator [Bacillus oleivorans]|uniref:MarR family transcriptional regulator n=1 Tax=Bacillus oleivorans TaxID=1448271 RepID=A0A285D6S8_9BACI|nr:MarR family transcriptional regulator [Bacillus oleivorans]SNX74948.1 MarR family transcriptional regulator [Bacillus oleivorans]